MRSRGRTTLFWQCRASVTGGTVAVPPVDTQSSDVHINPCQAAVDATLHATLTVTHTAALVAMPTAVAAAGIAVTLSATLAGTLYATLAADIAEDMAVGYAVGLSVDVVPGPSVACYGKYHGSIRLQSQGTYLDGDTVPRHVATRFRGMSTANVATKKSSSVHQ